MNKYEIEYIYFSKGDKDFKHVEVNASDVETALIEFKKLNITYYKITEIKPKNYGK
jgi:hypothetical protein